MVKGPNDTHWRFPTSGIVDIPDEWDLTKSAVTPSLRGVSEKVVARMFNGFSDGLDVTRWMGGEREDELAGVAAEAERMKELEEKERLEEQNMTMKERRLRRRAAKEKKGGLDEEMNKQAKEVIPEYVSFQGNAPMGCLIDYELAQKTFLFRAFVIDVMAVRPQVSVSLTLRGASWEYVFRPFRSFLCNIILTRPFAPRLAPLVTTFHFRTLSGLDEDTQIDFA